MGRLKRKNSDWQESGEIIRVPTQEHSEAADSVLQLFALLAFPDISERASRDKTAEALNAAFFKARIWGRRNSRSVQMQLPPAVRQLRIRKIQQQLNKFISRINRRLRAGNVAARFYYKDQHLRYTTPQPSGNIGIYILGPDNVREALHEAVRVEEAHGLNRERDDAVENERKHTWLPSIPVLHLALMMFETVMKFGFDKEPDFERIICELHARPIWLHDALLRAEGLRTILHECIPEFDPHKAVRMLPNESLPRS